MSRNFPDWLKAFVDYASYTEAPRLMHTWAGISAIAGCLRRKVWIDQFYFRWTPNFFVIFVAPPGVVSKSTTADVAMNLLRDVPGIKFGPDVVTWQSLVTSFAASAESFEYSGEWHPMSAMTLVASELGNLINMKDKEMVNLFIDLWDGRKKLEKQTKMSGNDIVEAPWINLIGCTTPHWIADNMPAATIGGGFTSRCVFLYADKKEKYLAYPADHIPPDIHAKRIRLVQDLEHIALNLCGEYKFTSAAKSWGERWYRNLWEGVEANTYDDQGNGYIARKQTHLHKLSMVLSASRRDDLLIDEEDLMLANTLLTSLEADMQKVFSRIGRTEDSLQAERFIEIVKKVGKLKYESAYAAIHAYFPDFRDFEGILTGAIRSGQVEVINEQDGMYLRASGAGKLTPEASLVTPVIQP